MHPILRCVVCDPVFGLPTHQTCCPYLHKCVEGITHEQCCNKKLFRKGAGEEGAEGYRVSRLVSVTECAGD